MPYQIELQSKHREAPHIWKEGGWFVTKKSAEFQAKQIRQTRMYKFVKVIPT